MKSLRSSLLLLVVVVLALATQVQVASAETPYCQDFASFLQNKTNECINGTTNEFMNEYAEANSPANLAQYKSPDGSVDTYKFNTYIYCTPGHLYWKFYTGVYNCYADECKNPTTVCSTTAFDFYKSGHDFSCPQATCERLIGVESFETTSAPTSSASTKSLSTVLMSVFVLVTGWTMSAEL